MRIGIDLGGTKIEGVALDDRGAIRIRERRATPSGDYAGTISTIVALIRDFEAAAGKAASVGVATPGALSIATGRLKNSNSVCLNEMPLDRDLEQALGRPIRIANDADCFALSEATDGAGAGAQVVFGVVVGTGTGGGVVVRGQLLSGPNRIAGEWGHNPLPGPHAAEQPGPPCYCGRHGCIETFLSGPGLARDYAAGLGASRLGAEQVCQRADAGEPRAMACVARYADRMARALATVINLLDPDVIVLGGGLSNYERLYTEVPARWNEYVFSDRVDTRLRRARHGDSSGVRGAAWLWQD